MKQGFYAILILLGLLLNSGCSTDSVTDNTSSSNAITTSSTVGSITLTATPNPVSALGTVAINATILDNAGVNVADGTAVSFSITTNGTLGSVSSTATTVAGVATGTFTAGGTAGTAIVTVSAGGASQTVSIAILGVNVGSIQFTSASPNVIGVKGSGQPETSIITFAVKDVNGQNASDGTNVTFSLDGPNGGELITPISASTTNGVVTTTLQSGTVAGPVRITATTVVTTVSISSLSTAVSIGGGIPSMSHFSLATSVVNLAGLAYVNLNANLSVFLADRFGNYNVLEGTSVSFLTESGAIDASNVTDANGITTALFRTQAPRPLIYSGASPFGASAPPTTGDPVNGHAMVIAVTRGEECFVDNNGNGTFDGTSIDTFPASCDLTEPHVDFDDDGVFDTTDDIYIDGNGNGVFDLGNGVWDGNTMIWKSNRLTMTAGISQVVLSPASGFAIGNGSGLTFRVCVADLNSNAPMAGSSITIAASKGKLTGGGSITIPDIGSGPFCWSFAVEDTAPTDTDPAESITIEIKDTWVIPNVGSLEGITLFTGTID